MVSRFTLLLCLATLLGESALGASPSLRNMSNERFEIIGLHLRSVTYVNELSAVTAEVAARHLDREGMAFPLPILVSLRPAEHANFEGDYRIRMEARSSVELDIRWEASMSLERTCRALADALLVQYALFNHGQAAVDQLRAWTVDALAHEIYLTLRPAEFVTLVDQLAGAEAPALSELLGASRLSPETVGDGYGYLLLAALKTAGLERRVVRGLFQQAVAGLDVEAALTSAIQPPEPTVDLLPLSTWWSGRLAAFLGRDYEMVETMAASRAWLAALARFDQPLKLESGDQTLNLRSIRKYRDNPQLKEWVEARYAILRLRIARINPAYYNAARSLGVLFEALLEDAPPHEYLHALTIYLGDWEDTKEMEAMIDRLIVRNQ